MVSLMVEEMNHGLVGRFLDRQTRVRFPDNWFLEKRWVKLAHVGTDKLVKNTPAVEKGFKFREDPFAVRRYRPHLGLDVHSVGVDFHERLHPDHVGSEEVIQNLPKGFEKVSMELYLEGFNK